MPEGICIMALDAKLKKDGGIECLNEYEKWLRTPKLRDKVTLKRMSGHEGWL